MGVGVEAKPTMSITVSLFCAPLTAGFYATQKQSLPNYYYCSICPSSTQCPPPPKKYWKSICPFTLATNRTYTYKPTFSDFTIHISHMRAACPVHHSRTWYRKHKSSRSFLHSPTSKQSYLSVLTWSELRCASPFIQILYKLETLHFFICGPGSSVGIATDYGLDGSGSNPGGGNDIFRPSRPALGPTQPPVKWVLGLSRGKAQPRCAADHSPPSSAAVMEE